MRLNHSPVSVTIKYLLDNLRADPKIAQHFEDIPDTLVKVTQHEKFLIDILSDGLPHSPKEIAIKADDLKLLTNWKNGSELLRAIGDETYYSDWLDDPKGPFRPAKDTLKVRVSGNWWCVTDTVVPVLNTINKRRLDYTAVIKGTRPSNAVKEAESILFDLLKDSQQYLEVIQTNVEASGLSWSTFRQAKANLGILSIKEGFPGKVVAWSLPKRGLWS